MLEFQQRMKQLRIYILEKLSDRLSHEKPLSLSLS